MFGATNIVKNYGGEKYVYSSYGLIFDEKDSRSFNDGFNRNVMIFGVDNSSVSHTDNLKNDPLILSEGSAFGINESFDAPEKNLY